MQEQKGRQIKYALTWDIVCDPKNPYDFRFSLIANPPHKQAKNPLVAICMNPSSADSEHADKTVATIERASVVLKNDGFAVFNAYPEYAVHAGDLCGTHANDMISKNTLALKNYLTQNSQVSEIWLAWGGCAGTNALIRAGSESILDMLNACFPKIRKFCFPSLKKDATVLVSNKYPRHPTPQNACYNLDISLSNKYYL